MRRCTPTISRWTAWPHLVVLLAFACALMLTLPAALVAAQECGYLEQASVPCQHGGTCVNGSCVCTPDYTSGTCGWPSKETCDCLQCKNGGNMTNSEYDHMSNRVHLCNCPPEWTGRNCDICRSADTCSPMFPDTDKPICDNTAIVVNYKVFDCFMPDLDPVIAEWNTSARVEIYHEGLNSSEGRGNFQMWNFVTFEMREIFYCDLWECGANGGEEEYTYTCAQTKCYFTGHLWWDERWINIVENLLVGTSWFHCFKPDSNGLMTCDLFQSGMADLTPKLDLKCFTGECISEPRPIVEQPVNKSGIVVASSGAVFLVALVVLGMFLYRNHQRKYYSFKGIDGKAIQFMDLADSGTEFANDTLLFENITYILDGKLIVDSVDGLALPGQVLAVVGASGAGKTTLLDILAQRAKRGKVSGMITINGNPVETSFIRITSYVDQEPAALGTLTVREMLMAAAQLRLPEIIKLQQKKERIQSLACELGIEHILDRRYGETGNRGISGGEKRRVQIACQLVTGPSIVFLDEPTSGLDAFNALAVCRFLKQYATRKKRTIIMSIHQPRADIFFSFDRLLVLGGGLSLYYGDTRQAKHYFESLGYTCPPDFNPADFILDVTVSEQSKLETLHRHFVQSDFYKQYLRERKLHSAEANTQLRLRSGSFAVISNNQHITTTVYGSLNQSPSVPPISISNSQQHLSHKSHIDGNGDTGDKDPLLGPQDVVAEGYKETYATSPFTQLSVLSGRSFSDMYRYPLLLRMHLVFAVVSGILIGIIFFNLTLDFAGTQNRIGMLLFILIVIAFGSMSSIGFMNREREQFTQERASGYYRPWAYYIVKVLYDLIPLRIVPALVLGLLVYYLTGLQSDPKLLGHFLLVLVMFNSVTALICLTISTVVRNTSLANLVAIITLLFFMLFQNALINLDAMPVYVSWITYLSPFRFALNSIMVNEFDGLMILFDPYGIEDPVLITGRSVLTLFSFHPDWAYSVDLYALAGMIGGWFLLGLLCLYIFVRDIR